jgi:hypothetical protein
MYRLIYKSTCSNEIDWPLVQSILHESEKNNQEKDISGVLLATNKHFLQVIEGKYEAVNDLFMHIVKDKRHTDLKLISFSVVDSMIFSGWGMRGLGVFDFNKDLEASLMEKYGEEDGSVKFPLEEWVALSLINDIRMVYQLPSWKAG